MPETVGKQIKTILKLNAKCLAEMFENTSQNCVSALKTIGHKICNSDIFQFNFIIA